MEEKEKKLLKREKEKRMESANGHEIYFYVHINGEKKNDTTFVLLLSFMKGNPYFQ